MELLQQPAAHQNHDGAQHDGTDDADHQHPLLVVRGHRKIGKDQQENKNIVHRQRLLDQVAGQKLQRLGIGYFGRTGAVFHRPPEQAVEQKAQGNPHNGPVERFFDADIVSALLFEHHKINEQRDQDDSDERGPEPQGSDSLHDKTLTIWSTDSAIQKVLQQAA